MAFIGFEVIADDAEEVKDPDRNIPLGILISLTVLLILYPMIVLTTLGTVPWNTIAGSEVPLTDAISRFLPRFGPPLLGIAGIIATVTTLNTAMLSATREAFTMSRDGMWPRFLSRLSRFRTPYAAVMVIGAIICAVAAIGLVDFLSYISSSGYLFVLFWSNLALIRLRKRYPDLKRPFKTPLYPYTVYLAMGTCLLIVAFTEKRALLFGAALLAALSLIYYLAPVANRFIQIRAQKNGKARNRILVPVANPKTGARLVHMAAILAQAIEGTTVCVFQVSPSTGKPFPLPDHSDRQNPPMPVKMLPDRIIHEVHNRNVPMYTKQCQAPSIASGILDEIEAHPNVKLILAGWPGPLDPHAAMENPVKTLLEKAQTNVLVLLDHHRGKIRNVLVPIGGGPHSRLALRLAYEIAEQENAKITALHNYFNHTDSEEVEDRTNFLREIIIDELGFIPARFTLRVVRAGTVTQGVMEETERESYDLLVMGASEEWGSKTRLFGSVDDWIIEHIEHCSVLLVRHYEPVAIHWLRRKMKSFNKEY